MNPPTSQPGQSSGQTIVIGGGGGTGSVAFHTHPATALSTDVGDDQLPDRLKALSVAVPNVDGMFESGCWIADGTSFASPDAATFWAGQTIYDGTLDQGFAEQIAYEIADGRRIFRRTALFGTWDAWEQIDRTFYDTRYRRVSDIDYQRDTQSADVTPNGTANSTLTGLSITVTSPGTSAVYAVRLKTDVTFVGSQTNIVELLVDGVAEAETINTGAAATGYRIPGSGEWRITGLAAGSRTFTAQTRNTAAGTNATVKATHTLMTVERVA